jgi:hypothetical protein
MVAWPCSADRLLEPLIAADHGANFRPSARKTTHWRPSVPIAQLGPRRSIIVIPPSASAPIREFSHSLFRGNDEEKKSR